MGIFLYFINPGHIINDEIFRFDFTDAMRVTSRNLIVFPALGTTTPSLPVGGNPRRNLFAPAAASSSIGASDDWCQPPPPVPRSRTRSGGSSRTCSLTVQSRPAGSSRGSSVPSNPVSLRCDSCQHQFSSFSNFNRHVNEP